MWIYCLNNHKYSLVKANFLNWTSVNELLLRDDDNSTTSVGSLFIIGNQKSQPTHKYTINEYTLLNLLHQTNILFTFDLILETNKSQVVKFSTKTYPKWALNTSGEMYMVDGCCCCCRTGKEWTVAILISLKRSTIRK